LEPYKSRCSRWTNERRESRKELREAQYFLNQMIEKESLAFGDKEPFDLNLSAFLGAARSVDYRLRHEQPGTYPTWRTAWDDNLSPADTCLIRFMVDDRNDEVHKSGSGRSVGTQGIEVGDTYADKSGTLYTTPAAALHLSEQSAIPRVVIRKPTYAFTIAGTDRKATEACAEYLTLLHQMVEKFKDENP
jgi:hypothetical protein